MRPAPLITKTEKVDRIYEHAKLYLSLNYNKEACPYCGRTLLYPKDRNDLMYIREGACPYCNHTWLRDESRNMYLNATFAIKLEEETA